MNIGVIIPDRGDRPDFLRNCIRMMDRQSLKPVEVVVVDFTPESDQCDITKRYRLGYDILRNKGIDVIALIENDDWYHKDYLKYMGNKWMDFNRPDILGTKESVYYHLSLRKFFKMYHNYRSAAMNTLIKPDLNFPWCPDHEAFTDIHLWQKLKGNLFHPDKIYSMGMKHGIGKCGARHHVDRLNKFIFPDPDFDYLKDHLDEESFNFYTNIFIDGPYQNSIQ